MPLLEGAVCQECGYPVAVETDSCLTASKELGISVLQS